MAEEKKKRRLGERGVSYKDTKTDTLPDGTVIDLDNYDWGDYADLKKSKKAFVIWYTLPNQPAFNNSTKAALRAGYARRSAYQIRSLIAADEKWSNCIKMFEDRIVKTSVSDAYKKAIQEKIKRATFNITDFYETKEIENEDGDKYNRLVAKSLEDIDAEKASVIDNVEINQSGIATFKLPNREKEINDIIKLNAEINQEKSTGDYDVETTVETIKDNLKTIKTTVRVSNQKVRENAENYIENSENQPDFD